MQIDYGAIIPYTAILQEKICKVSSPFLVNLFAWKSWFNRLSKTLCTVPFW